MKREIFLLVRSGVFRCQASSQGIAFMRLQAQRNPLLTNPMFMLREFLFFPLVIYFSPSLSLSLSFSSAGDISRGTRRCLSVAVRADHRDIGGGPQRGGRRSNPGEVEKMKNNESFLNDLF